MMTMIERVERAMWEKRREFAAREHPTLLPLEEWEDGSVPRANGVTEEARAAIEAMREPTDAMLEAGPLEPYMDRYVWARMIDAELLGPPSNGHSLRVAIDAYASALWETHPDQLGAWSEAPWVSKNVARKHVHMMLKKMGAARAG